MVFYMKGLIDLMLVGLWMVKKGYESFWGLGCYKFGLNWFWYFNLLFGMYIEYDVDMDKYDGEWIECEVLMLKEVS